MGQSQPNPAPSFDAHGLESMFYKQRQEPLIRPQPVQQHTFRRLDEIDGQENVVLSHDGSSIEFPKVLDLHKSPASNRELTFTETVIDESQRFNIQESDAVHLTSKIEVHFDDKSSSFETIQGILVSISEGVSPTLLKNISSYSLQRLLEAFTTVIDDDFQAGLKQEEFSEMTLQTFILENILTYSRLITQMAMQLEDMMKMSLIKKLGLFKLDRIETKSSVLSQIHQENPAQFIKKISFKQLNDYLEKQYNSMDDENQLFHLKQHTNAILKADQVEELPVVKPQRVELSTCNRSVEQGRSVESSRIETDRHTPSTTSEFLQKSSMLRAEISNLMSKHKQHHPLK